MLKLITAKRQGLSSRQIDIEDITDGIIKLPDNSYASVLLTGSVNFELKSEPEQDALIDIFEGFLNAIGFNFQILIRTREVDMEDYLNNLSQKIALEPIAIYKQQLKHYKKFVLKLITDNKILNRYFYIIVPLKPNQHLDFAGIKDQLNLRLDIVAKNLARMGIASRPLSSIELIDLFYSFYSPERAKSQPLSEQALSVINDQFITRRMK